MLIGLLLAFKSRVLLPKSKRVRGETSVRLKSWNFFVRRHVRGFEFELFIRESSQKLPLSSTIQHEPQANAPSSVAISDIFQLLAIVLKKRNF